MDCMVSSVVSEIPKRFSADIMVVWSRKSKACLRSQNKSPHGLFVREDHSIALRGIHRWFLLFCCRNLNFLLRMRCFAHSLVCNKEAQIDATRASSHEVRICGFSCKWFWIPSSSSSPSLSRQRNSSLGTPFGHGAANTMCKSSC